MIDLKSASCFFIASIIIILGLKSIKHVFIKLAKTTLKLLNVLLSTHISDDTKQAQLIQLVKSLLGSLFICVSTIFFIVLLSCSPFYFVGISIDKINLIGSEALLSNLIIFTLYKSVNFFKKTGTTYNDWTKLLHHLILDNYNIERFLFNREKNKYIKYPIKKNPYLIVTGFARSGTTALTELLYSSKNFSTLYYRNMPFLLSVRTWLKIYNPNKDNIEERAHKDGISIGLTSIEALEEHFFKVQLNDSYINNDSLLLHNITPEILKNYEAYRFLIQQKPDKTYLAKNNNLILRLNSFLEQDEQLNVVLLFRDPLQHAASILKQHKSFKKQQKEDAFITTYMNWLGHHEFGEGHLPFNLGKSENVFDQDSINYHLQNWINYYEFTLQFKAKNKVLFLAFEDLNQNPEQLLSPISQLINIDLSECEISINKQSKHVVKVDECDPSLLNIAYQIHSKLKTED